ncbi:sugar transferase [Micromonospora sp. NPDC049559]|uniref:sugar transferase n=1 Tax=Micromonospora sp. NPDC049559 TaxID=3155923 RepID=UPI00343EB0F8
MTRRTTAYDVAKRLAEPVIAAVGLVLLAPLILVVAVAVAATLGRPVFFRQTRPGLYGRPFELVKFRTMRPAPESARLADADRLTPFGRWLRSTSLDELPTLWNVVRGDMSLVGPRPLLMRYLTRYTPEQARRHEVRPGLTGLAQVRGRNALTWEQRFAYDVRYVEDRSLGLDLRILAETVRVVLRREGITAPGHATIAEFLGSAGQPGADAQPRTDGQPGFDGQPWLDGQLGSVRLSTAEPSAKRPVA